MIVIIPGGSQAPTAMAQVLIVRHPRGRDMDTEEVALSQLERQLQKRGYSVTRTRRNSPEGDLHAKKGSKSFRFEVKGLEKRNGVWLSDHQIDAVDIIVVYVADEDSVWVLSRKDARELTDYYRSDFVRRKGRPPKGPGWNASQFPPPTGWPALDRLLKDNSTCEQLGGYD